MKAFFSDSPDLFMRGPEATSLYNELKEQENERKRTKKELYKEKLKSLPQKERAKIAQSL